MLLALIGLLAGCSLGSHGRSRAPTETSVSNSTAATSTAASPAVTLTVYGPDLRPRRVRVAATRAVAAAALHAIGVDARVEIARGTATVALPRATETQIAQIVLTLTEFPSVRRVDVAGRTGVTRDQALPPIVVDAPAAGATVPATFAVRGTASVYEATLVLELRRGSTVLGRKTVTASEGAPARGSFSATLHASSPGPATIAVYAPSAVDASPQHEQDVEVMIGS